jgi:hypothetical protein
MASKLTDIGKNAVEDGVEDFVSAFLFRRMRKITEPFLKDFSSDSEFDSAMQSFIQTLSMGVTLYAYTMIMNFFFQRSAKMGLALWTYIVSGVMKRKIAEKLKASKYKGNKAVKALSLVMGADRTSDRIAVAGLIKDNVNSFDSHKLHFQNQHQKADDKLDKMSFSASNLKNSMEKSILTRFTHKTFTGTWKNNTTDRKLYEKATGVVLAETGDGSWTSLYSQLNKYTEFAKTTNGEIINLSTSLQMVLSKSGFVR